MESLGYNFVDFGQMQNKALLSIQAIVNGDSLDEILTSEHYSFTTVSVDGRGKTSYNVESFFVRGRHGEIYSNSQLEPRSIIIHARVRADRVDDYRDLMNKINALMFSKKVHTLSFTDEGDATFYGSCVRVTDEDERSLSQHVEIEFVCHDPFKYTEVKTETVDSASVLNLTTDIAVTPEMITLNFTSNADAKSWTLTNVTQDTSIVFNQIRNVDGSVIRIVPKKNYIGYLTPSQGGNHIDGLNVRYSNFDEFAVHDGDQLVISRPVTSIEVTYRGAKI